MTATLSLVVGGYIGYRALTDLSSLTQFAQRESTLESARFWLAGAAVAWAGLIALTQVATRPAGLSAGRRAVGRCSSRRSRSRWQPRPLSLPATPATPMCCSTRSSRRPPRSARATGRRSPGWRNRIPGPAHHGSTSCCWGRRERGQGREGRAVRGAHRHHHGGLHRHGHRRHHAHPDPTQPPEDTVPEGR
ncbi:hypothetical protein G7085_12610 [Tessaracoccus sp. HDW20]|uniref:hypothetical protein n=1 Tax=Tessaracoccus coleopterorum TaxID=2714950 RepID=UPI0018D2EA29|nr:hypothetical protein [Tessaracoccus coleopterorum]NHB85180.1 hypothetical protein [Tessaracoccus coleopterorum]